MKDVNEGNAYTNIVAKELARQIRDKMSRFVSPFNYGNCFCDGNDKEEFQIVKDLCSLINELLSCIDIKNRILEMAINTTTDEFNRTNINVKYETFEMLRNLFAHFPIFNTWNEVYINEDLLNWNNPKNSSILKYFAKYHGKRLVYDIYTKYNAKDEWHIGCTVDITIPESIPKNGELYLSEFMTFSDVVRTFCIIDYYLDYFGFDLLRYQYLSV